MGVFTKHLAFCSVRGQKVITFILVLLLSPHMIQMKFTFVNRCVELFDKKFYKYNLVNDTSSLLNFHLLSRLKSQSSLVLKIFATVPSYTSTKVVSVRKQGLYFYGPGKNVFWSRNM